MPRKRERTTTKASWTVETLENAVRTIRQDGKSVYKVSKETGIPYSTLKKRYKLAKSNNDTYKCPPKLGRPSVFTKEQEVILADHLHKMTKKFYGLTRAKFCKVCYEMAEKFGVADQFNETKKSAGKDFLAGFLQRHPDLSIRKAEATSINRILGFNKVEVDLFFKNLENVMTKHNFSPSQIYNMDETGVTTVQETEKIIAPKGQKRVGTVTSWERGKNVTVICAMSASGSFIPPLFIFPRQRHSPQLEKDGPPGATYTCSHNGWTNETIFIKWLRHFINHAKPTAEQPVLLVLDNHNSHCTLEAWELARANNVLVLSIPPHSSHRLQPLDVTFFGPLKRAYNKECDMFIKSRNMVKITPYDIAGLFNKAYARVACLDKGISGFKATGIFPMNPAIFSEDDFVVVDEHQNLVSEQASLAPVAQSERHISQQLATDSSDPLPSTSRDTSCPKTLPSASRDIGNPETLPSASREADNSDHTFCESDDPETVPSTSRGIQEELKMGSSTPNIEQEQIQEQIDIDRDGSPSILNDPHEEAQIANDTPTLPININPVPILSAKPASANPATTSFTTNDDFQEACSKNAEKLDFEKVLSAVSPLPNITNKNKTSRQKQHSVILTSTPMKAVLEEKEKKRAEKKTKVNTKKKGKTDTKARRPVSVKKENKSVEKKVKKKGQASAKESKCTKKKGNKRKKTTIKKEKVKRVKKMLFEDETDTSEEEDVVNLCDDESEYSEEENLCTICCETGKNNEMWYRCRGCGKWAHKECSGCDSPVDYICIFCLNI